MSAGYATAKYIYENNYSVCAVLAKNSILKNTIAGFNIKTVSLHSNIIVPLIVIGYNKKFCYKDLCRIFKLVKNGTKVISTDCDRLYISGTQIKPGGAWYIAAIEKVTEEKVEAIGKPNDYALRLLLKEMQTDSKKCLFIGDNIETDIKCANDSGVVSCLILGGVTQKDEITTKPSKECPV
jgi:arabinose operon protein AraL